MNKQELIHIWEDTEDLCDGEFADATETSLKAQKIYTDEIILPNFITPYFNTTIKVTRLDTISAAYNQVIKGNKVAILNFASATNPGGGTMKGSSAQEECICRCTNLLPCLFDSEEAFNKFYQYHTDLHDNAASNRLIYTPNILILKDCAYNRITPKYVDVITCAAPNLRKNPKNSYNSGANENALILDDKTLYNIHVARATQILKSAIANHCGAIILGAFGCGAFKNNPEVVAKAWNETVQKYKQYFHYIEFAVFCKDDTTNFDVFKRIIKEE